MTIQNFNLAVSAGKGNCSPHVTTFEDVLNYIKKLRLDDNLALRLTEKARSIPPGALNHFVKNINNHIAILNRTPDNVENT